jgi:DNA-directed RNA polymerase subunit beta
MVERNNYGSIEEVTTPPNLIDIQKKSFVDFLQSDLSPQERDSVGFQAVFQEIFPIESYDGQCELDFVKYEIQPAKMDEVECLKEGETYAAPLYVTFRLKDGEEIREEDIFMGDIPLMTRDGSFIINGAERVIVSQLHRSPGICFEQSTHANGSTLYSFRVIPDRGSWIEVQFDTNDLINIYLDRKRRRRKVLAPTLFRALGYGSDEELLGIFYSFKKISLSKKVKEAALTNLVLKGDVVDPDSGNIIARRYEPMTLDLVSQISAAGFSSVDVVDISADEGIFLKSVEKDPSRDTEEALKDIYSKLRPGDPPSVANAQQMLMRIFGDPRRYDLGRVGRYKIRQKLNLKANPDSRVLNKEDFVESVK